MTWKPNLGLVVWSSRSMKRTITALAFGCIVGFGIAYSIYHVRLAKAHDAIRQYTEVLSGISIDDQKAIEQAIDDAFTSEGLIDLMKEIKERGDPLRIAEEATFSALKEVATLHSLKENKIELIEKRSLRRVFDYYEDYKEFDFGEGMMGTTLKESFDRIENLVIKNEYWIERKNTSNQSVLTTPEAAPPTS